LSGNLKGKTNFSEITKKFDTIQKNYEDTKQAILIKAQELLLANIQRLAPRNTGDYAASWKKGDITENSASIVTNQGKLYIILEFTGSAVPARQRKPPEKPYVFQSKSGETIFTFKIKASGFNKIPHAGPAMKLTLKEISTFIADELRKLI